MSGFAKPEIAFARQPGWFDQLVALLGRELAPNSRKVRTAARLATIGTLGAGLIASCHVTNELGTYIVWLLVGAGPMMSFRKACGFLIAEALCLCASVVIAGILVETPWLMLPFVFVLISFATYLATTRKLGSALLLIEVVCLDIFYGVVFAPDQIGWQAAGAFGGSVLAFGTLIVFDNWLWPDRGEEILLESLGASLERQRLRLLEGRKLLFGSTRRATTGAAGDDFGSARTHGLFESSCGRGCVRASPCDAARGDHARRSHRSRSGSPDHRGAAERTTRDPCDGAARASSDGGRDRRSIG
jgi:predicted membrane protein